MAATTGNQPPSFALMSRLAVCEFGLTGAFGDSPEAGEADRVEYPKPVNLMEELAERKVSGIGHGRLLPCK